MHVDCGAVASLHCHHGDQDAVFPEHSGKATFSETPRSLFLEGDAWVQQHYPGIS